MKDRKNKQGEVIITKVNEKYTNSCIPGRDQLVKFKTQGAVIEKLFNYLKFVKHFDPTYVRTLLMKSISCRNYISSNDIWKTRVRAKILIKIKSQGLSIETFHYRQIHALYPVQLIGEMT